jgi:hypothetical protein
VSKSKLRKKQVEAKRRISEEPIRHVGHGLPIHPYREWLRHDCLKQGPKPGDSFR